MRVRIERLNKASLIDQDLQARIKELGNKPIIQASLNVEAGHDYWWFLEYGTATGGKGGISRESATQGIKLIAPASVKGRTARHSPYPIMARPNQITTYSPIKARAVVMGRKVRQVWKERTVQRTKLRFMYQGTVHFAWSVMHHGIPAYGVIRREIEEFRRRLGARFDTLIQQGRVPRRRDLLDIVNDEIDELYARVVSRMPRSQDAADYWAYIFPKKHPQAGKTLAPYLSDSNPNMPDDYANDHLADAIGSQHAI